MKHFLKTRQPEHSESSEDSAASGEVRLAEAPADEFETSESVVVRKNARLRAKVEAARAHLQKLPKSDRRSRLLHAAVVRRDEVLLDALLQDLEA